MGVSDVAICRGTGSSSLISAQPRSASRPSQHRPKKAIWHGGTRNRARFAQSGTRRRARTTPVIAQQVRQQRLAPTQELLRLRRRSEPVQQNCPRDGRRAGHRSGCRAHQQLRGRVEREAAGDGSLQRVGDGGSDVQAVREDGERDRIAEAVEHRDARAEDKVQQLGEAFGVDVVQHDGALLALLEVAANGSVEDWADKAEQARAHSPHCPAGAGRASIIKI
jgi:hypothetical protein